MKIQITEQDIQYMTQQCVNMLMENNFTNSLDKVRSSFYIKGKRKGLMGDELKAYADEKMSEWEAKQQALNDYRKDLRREHPMTDDDSEFYSGSLDMADTFGFNDGPYTEDED